MKMALKVKKGAPAPSKAEAKAKVLKAKKAVLKGTATQKKKEKKRFTPQPLSDGPRHYSFEGCPHILKKVSLGETSLTTMPSSNFP